MEGMLNPADLLAMVRRRWLLLVLPLVIGTPIIVAIAMILPPVYTSTARILVETQQIPSDLAQSTVTQSAAESIEFIQQRLLTRQNLLDIAEQYNVFAGRSGLSPTEIVAQMRAATTFRPTAGGNQRRRRDVTLTGVDIAFRANNAQVAARVANELVNRIIETNVQERSNRAAGTLDFFNEQVERFGAELNAQSARITAYKNENFDALPETLSSRQGELSSLRERMASRATQMALLEDRRVALEQTLAIGVNDAPAASTLSPNEQELRRLQGTLAAQRATLSDNHPNVRVLMARIEALEQTISDSREAPLTAGQTGTTAGVSGRAAELMLQIEGIESQLRLLRDQADADRARMRVLEASLAETPAVEMELRSLERNYTALQQRYENAVLRRAQAELGERLEAGQQAERFEVIEQALPPESPDSPNRPLIVAAGVVGSGAIGVGLMILAELLNRCIRTARDLERQLQIRPIVAIPYLQTPSEIQRGRWRSRLLVLLVLVGIPLAVLAVDQFYLPLPLLAARGLNAVGISWLLDLLAERAGL